MADKGKGGGGAGLGGVFGPLSHLLKAATHLADATDNPEAKERVREIKRRLGDLGPGGAESPGSGGVLGGFVEGLARLADIATTLKESEGKGEIDLGGGKKAGYSFGIRIGPLGEGRKGESQGVRVQSFGHKISKTPKGAVVEEFREPEVDVIEEDDHVLLTGDMPGVEPGDIHYELKNQTLTLTAQGSRKYKKEFELPCSVEIGRATLSCRNGVVELKLPRLA